MSSEFSYRVQRITSLEQVPAESWNALADDDPFLRHEFLVALERTGCVGPSTAWQPAHLVVEDETQGILGGLPLYIKYDSRGEFVFDWSWADAFERAGRSYYPKLVCAVPFTPATGPRLLVNASADRKAVTGKLLDAAARLASEIGASSIHALFPQRADCTDFADAGYMARKSCQFHWHNAGYASFAEFLATFSSAKRKKVRRERRRIDEAGIRFDRLAGDEPSPAQWDAIFDFYSRTFLRRGRAPYLNRDLFDEVARTMPQNLVIMLAHYDRQPIATAICFHGNDTLYGRYWGSLADFHSLHFEACYYQGIEFCIEQGIQTFEPGTQGEHKISRGFRPTATWSYHWMPIFARQSTNISTARPATSINTSTSSGITSRIAAASDERADVDSGIGAAERPARSVESADSAQWTPRGRRQFTPRVAHICVSARHLSLV